MYLLLSCFFFFQAEDGIRDDLVTGVQTCVFRSAGGAIINRADDSLRYSDDLDIFHDAAEAVKLCADADAAVLQAAGCSVEWTLRSEERRVGKEWRSRRVWDERRKTAVG